jgi:hypothetical protein
MISNEEASRYLAKTRYGALSAGEPRWRRELSGVAQEDSDRGPPGQTAGITRKDEALFMVRIMYQADPRQPFMAD